MHRPEQRLSILRSEIVICAEEVADRTLKKKRMIELLHDIDPAHSRAVVFVTSRRLAEELAATSREEGVAAAPFHAGLPTKVRLETYEKFLEGGVTALCATKAFGMGMDIGNIHLVIHFGPPSSLEDYIQEIGRAARDRSSLQKAGLSRAHAHLLYEPGDFARMKDRLKNSFLSRVDLKELHDLLLEEWERADSPKERPLTVRAGDLAAHLRGGECTPIQVRMGLFWLEKLNRVKLGFYAPAQVEVEIDLDRAKATRRSLSKEARDLLKYLQRNLESNSPPAVVLFSAREAVVSLSLPTQDRLFSLIGELARKKVVRYRRELVLPLAYRRAQEARAGVTNNEWPLLRAVDAVLTKTRTDLESPGLDGLVYKHSNLEEQFRTIARDHFQAEEFTWLDPAEREDQAQREQRVFPRCEVAVLRLLRGLRIVQVRQEVSKEEGLTLCLTHDRQDWDIWLEALPGLVRESLRSIAGQETDREPADMEAMGEINAQDLLLSVAEAARDYRIHFGISHLQAILRFLRDLGYLSRSDVFVPITLEVSVVDRSSINLSDDGQDAGILRQFEEQKQQRMLRLAALRAIPDLVSDLEKLRNFVEQRYFKAASSEELIALLEENLPAGNDILTQLREEALQELLDGSNGRPGLSEEQRAVYDAPVDHHLMVVAGPGAGKTHTLLARLVRLVHKEDVLASDILVLAFTRAVVSELRYRLQDLLSRLGYGTLARRIHVTTFHSFVLGMLREFDLVGDDFRLDGIDWFKRFEQCLRSNPELRRRVATGYRYVFVDEFQDVHGARYSLLEYLAGGRETYLMIVGDDDQSIYDYERENGEGNASHYFRHFESYFSPMRFDLTLNYRSAQAIVDFSQDVIASARVPDRLKEPDSLKAYYRVQGVAEWERGDTDIKAIVQRAENDLNSLSDENSGQSRDRRTIRLPLLTRRSRDRLEGPSRPSRGNTIAILARTNADVYRAKSQLQQELGDIFSLLVQGEESRFIDRRDVAWVMELLREGSGSEQLVRSRLLESLNNYLSTSEVENWLRDQPPDQHELWYLAQEFLEGAGPQLTVADFTEYVREMSRNGNYLRIVARRQANAADGKGRILLSTVHKVKGIEFPAVILLSSDMRVSKAEIDQELRVMYVGMTRAENVLIALQGEREKQLLDGHTFEPVDTQRDGLAVAPSLGDVLISKFGYEWANQKRIFRRVRRGDTITIVRNQGLKNPFWIRHDVSGRDIGLLAGLQAKRSELTRTLYQRFAGVNRFVGLEVTGVYRRYVDRDRRHDENHPTSYYKNLCSQVKKQGYYHVVEIGGLLRPESD